MIHYNSPDHAKQRQEVVPPSMDELGHIMDWLNVMASDEPLIMETLQRLIWHYENLEHFYDATGGWEKHNKMTKAFNDLEAFQKILQESDRIVGIIKTEDDANR